MAWLVCILESPTSNTVGIKWWEYVNCVGLSSYHFYIKYIDDENNIDIKELRNQILDIQIYITLILLVILCLYLPVLFI